MGLNFRRIDLTPPQREWVEWALTGPIAEHDADSLVWDKDISPNEAVQFLKDRDATFLHGNTLIMEVNPEGDFIGDLLNMLEDVAPDVAGGYGFDEAWSKNWRSAHAVTHQRASAALNAAEKIRKAYSLQRGE